MSSGNKKVFRGFFEQLEVRVLPSSILTTITNFFGRKVEPVLDRAISSIVSQVHAAEVGAKIKVEWFIEEGAKGRDGSTNIYYGIKGDTTHNHLAIYPDGTTKFLRESGKITINKGERVGLDSSAVDTIMAGFATASHVFFLI